MINLNTFFRYGAFTKWAITKWKYLYSWAWLCMQGSGQIHIFLRTNVSEVKKAGEWRAPSWRLQGRLPPSPRFPSGGGEGGRLGAAWPFGTFPPCRRVAAAVAAAVAEDVEGLWSGPRRLAGSFGRFRSPSAEFAGRINAVGVVVGRPGEDKPLLTKNTFHVCATQLVFFSELFPL